MSIALVFNTQITGAQNGGTSGSVDSTGCTLLLMHVSYYAAPGTISDSKGNTWTPLTVQSGGGAAEAKTRWYYAVNPTVGTGHTFTMSGTNVYCVTQVLGFSGVKTASPFDVENGTAQWGGGIGDQQPGSITPSENDELVVSGMGANSPGGTYSETSASMTVTNQTSYTAGVNEGGVAAYKIQTTAAAINPTWHSSGGNTGSKTSTIASFKAATGAIACVVLGTSVVTANLAGAGAVACAVVCTATVTAALGGVGALVCTVNGASVVTPNLTGAGALICSVAAAATVTCALSGAGPMVCTIAGAAVVTPTLTATGALVCAIAGAATVTASLADAASGWAVQHYDHFTHAGDTAELDGTTMDDGQGAWSKRVGSLVGIVSGEAKNGTNARKFYYDSASTDLDKQRVTISPKTFDGCAPAARMQSDGSCFAFHTRGGTSNLYRWDSGAETSLGTYGGGISNTDQASVGTDGDQIWAEKNGVVVIGPVTDPAYPTGKPGFFLDGSNALAFDDWQSEIAAASGAIACVVLGTSTVTCALSGAGAIACAVLGTATVTAQLGGAGAMACSIAGAATVTANLTGAGAVACVIVGTCVVTASLASGMSCAIVGSATVTANLAGAGALQVAIQGTAVVTAAMSGAGDMTCLVSGVATLTLALSDAATASAMGIFVRVVTSRTLQLESERSQRVDRAGSYRLSRGT